MFTATTYEREFGYTPVEDDLERLQCERAGQHGHTMCGQHTCCGNPRFIGHDVTECPRAVRTITEGGRINV